jgi:hypothetical protein
VPETRGHPGNPHTTTTAVPPGTPLSSGGRRDMLRKAILTELPLWLSVFTLFALAVLF